MGRLSGFNGREVMRVAETDGWELLRTSGDHFVYRKPGVPENVSIPDHRPVQEGTLRHDLDDATSLGERRLDSRDRG